MSKIYLAVDFYSEGWQLDEYDTAFEAIEAIKAGSTFGHPWKILKELDIKVEEKNNYE